MKIQVLYTSEQYIPVWLFFRLCNKPPLIRVGIFFININRNFQVDRLIPIDIRGVINGKTGKGVAFPKFLNKSTLSQSERADYAQPLALPH